MHGVWHNSGAHRNVMIKIRRAKAVHSARTQYPRDFPKMLDGVLDMLEHKIRDTGIEACVLKGHLSTVKNDRLGQEHVVLYIWIDIDPGNRSDATERSRALVGWTCTNFQYPRLRRDFLPAQAVEGDSSAFEPRFGIVTIEKSLFDGHFLIKVTAFEKGRRTLEIDVPPGACWP